MTWYLSDLKRWKDERERLELLAQEADWFRPIGWRADDNFRLVLDADIAAAGRIYPIFLRYPEQFPYTPPSVFPRGDDSRWSAHQYGPGGELCLEYGPDNWMPDMTGDLLIHSARRLVDGENPPSGQGSVVPSRHATTLGQRLRTETRHLLVTRPLEDYLAQVPVSVPYAGNLLGAFHREVTAQFIDQIIAPDGTAWNDPTIPAHISYELHERHRLQQSVQGRRLPSRLGANRASLDRSVTSLQHRQAAQHRASAARGDRDVPLAAEQSGKGGVSGV